MIETVCEGKLSILDVITAIKKNVSLAKRHDTRLFLVDCLALVDEKEHVFENYEVGIFLSTFLDQIPRNMRDAIVLPENEIGRTNLRFFETVTRNRGLNVRVFDTREGAFEWLLAPDI